MRSTLLWSVLLLGGVLLLGNTADAWNRQIFNRYSRNLMRRNGGGGGGGGAVGMSLIAPDGSDFDNNNANNAYDEFNALFGLANGGRRNLATGQQAQTQLQQQHQQQQPEIYGIVEPLIEDTPCADRACNMNDDCCPTGVCVNTYGEGKCVYVYGQKREICQRSADCAPGTTCQRDYISGIWMCKEDNELKRFGDECNSSTECNVAKGMCCQLQRSHHRVVPKKICAYFRDPFVCIDIM